MPALSGFLLVFHVFSYIKKVWSVSSASDWLLLYVYAILFSCTKTKGKGAAYFARPAKSGAVRPGLPDSCHGEPVA